jgi:hypothetical protein
MPIMNFSQFINSSVLLVFAKSKLRGDNFAKDYDQVFKVCSDFFKLVREITICSLPHHREFPEIFLIPDHKTKFDIMYDNFSVFTEFALKNINILDINTLCNGLETQIKKFISEYNFYLSLDCIDPMDLCESDYLPFYYLPSFKQVALFAEMNVIQEVEWIAENNTREYEDIITQKMNYELKQMKTELHTKRVSGHRQDFEKHLFNKGLNKTKRERFVLKERKNKKTRDFCI